MHRYKMIAFVIAVAVVFWLLSMGCARQGTGSTPAGDETTESGLRSQSAPISWDDVFGEHNPKMIGGVGGELTKQPWYLYLTWSGNRVTTLYIALQLYYSQHETFPASWEAFEESGFFVIRSLDPIDGQPINYGVAPTAADDFHNIALTPSADRWLLDGRRPVPPGEWADVHWEFPHPDDPAFDTMIEKWRTDYPTPTALKGALLAETFHYLLFNYESRRAAMPTSAEDLLDGLWTVGESWAANNPDIDPSQPGTFVFGHDEDRLTSTALWHDLDGTRYILRWRWEPWPTGWKELPTPDQREGMHGIPWPYKPPEEGYVPPTVLWTCSLTQSS